MPSAGLGHVATASFLASRLVPTGGFAVALAGGVAVARASEREGFRSGAGTSAAAMLQTVAIMGPARVGIPLTQAVSAPVLGWMEARGRGTVAQALAAAAIRLAHHVVGFVFYAWIILGIDAYTGTYDRLLGWLPLLPDGETGALIATAISIVAWAAGASTVQALVYRRGLGRWPAPEGAPSDDDQPAPERCASSFDPRFDPRAVLLAAIVAFGLLVASTAWLLLAAVAGWLAVAWLFSRGDRSPLRAGLVLTVVLALVTLAVGLIGGLGVDEVLRRAVRAGLLVLVATWMRSAAGEAGVREVFRRVLRRFARVPIARETSVALDGLGSTQALADSGRRLIARLRGVEKEPVPLTDAVLDWVAGEAGRHTPAPASPHRALRVRPFDGLLVVLVVTTAFALPFGA
jgi:hypothetical protein